MEKSQQKLLLHIEQTPLAVIEWDIDFKATYWNPSAEKIFGFTKEEAIGEHAMKLIVPEIRSEHVKSIWNALLEHKGGTHSFNENVTKTGQRIVCEWYNTPLVDQSGKVIGVSSFVQDITQQEMADKALKESEARLNSFSNATFEGIVITENGRITDFNDQFSEIIGYKSDQLMNENILKFVVEEDKASLQSDIQSVKLEPYELSLIHKNGDLVYVEVHSQNISVNDRLTRISAVRDITKRIMADKELKKALLDLNKLKEQLVVENSYLQEEIKITYNFGQIVGKNSNLKKMFRLVEQVAASSTTVMITGETGTGKELIARALHELSNRHDHPLIKINCAALPANLIESELFGHEKGAFTGAMSRKPGRFELAHKGTIFLDEIGDLPLDLQAKMLRVLQEGEFEIRWHSNA